MHFNESPFFIFKFSIYPSMKRIINRIYLLKLALNGPVSRQFDLMINNKVIGELYNQKRDFFYQNFLAALVRLDNGEIEKVVYYLKGQDKVSFIKLRENEYEIEYSITDERIKTKIEEIIWS